VTATAVLLGLCLLLALPLAVTAVRQRALAAMALRNVGRRRTEAALVIGGALLGTAIITSAFVVGDVIDGAVADEARTRYGPIDLTVTTADRDTFDAATAIVRDAVRDGDLATSGLPDLDAADRGGVDGLLDVTVTTATIEAPARDTALPRVEVVALDLAEARTFGGEATDTGLASAGDLAPGEVLVSAATAERLHLDTGDRLLVHVADTTTEVSVAEVLEDVGLAGYGGVIVAPGTLPEAAAAAEGRRRSATSCSCPSPVACSTPARRPATPPTPCGPRWPGCPTCASMRPRPPCSTSPNRRAPGSPNCSAPSARSACWPASCCSSTCSPCSPRSAAPSSGCSARSGSPAVGSPAPSRSKGCCTRCLRPCSAPASGSASGGSSPSWPGRCSASPPTVPATRWSSSRPASPPALRSGCSSRS
jgi:hypothetical protein